MTSAAFLCSACSASFTTNTQRREHMRTDWHVENVKRRVTTLPPINQEEFELAKAPVIARSTSKTPRNYKPHYDPKAELRHIDIADDEDEEDGNSSDQETHHSNAAKCLFCLSLSATIEENIDHMEHQHGFRIAAIEELQEGLEPLLWYLDIVINRFLSCLYCSRTKHSAEAIRAHMLGKAHCMLDMSPASEYLEFWDTSSVADDDSEHTPTFEPRLKEEMGSRMLSPDEMMLQSGRVATSRKGDIRPVRHTKLQASAAESALVSTSPQEPRQSEPVEPKMSKEMQLMSSKDRMAIAGLSNAEQRVVLATQRKLRSQAFRETSARRWIFEKAANKQQHSQKRQALQNKHFKSKELWI